MKNATNQMLCWNPGSSDVALVPWPDYAGASDRFECTGLACNNAIREMTFEQRKTAVFIEAVHLIVRDGVEPKALHAALLALEEYKDGLAEDMPGMTA